MKNYLTIAIFILTTSVFSTVNAQNNSMSFFVTSTSMGAGGDLGGLAGADGHCQKLATAAGAGSRQWRAYLSSERIKGKRGVSARDRIGTGPWYNAKGVLIADNVNSLHLYNKTITKATALDENGNLVNGRGDKPNQHDILTGTRDDGTAYFPDDDDHTCNNWSSSDAGSTQLGHHDRHGGGNTSWNSAHASRGCSIAALKKTGGDARLYCFAAD
ncbi:MAG: hypothetical protein GY820_47510 [Gammaproteobacteria bacterium]|nr:hypothetical protein [Gammaproteobacteria bacterium]